MKLVLPCAVLAVIGGFTGSLRAGASSVDEALDQAWERFLSAGLEQRRAVVDEIESTARESEDPELSALVKAAYAARRGLRALPVEPTKYYLPAEWAPKEAAAGRSRRTLLDAGDPRVEQMAQRHRPWENLPPFHAEFVYDFASGRARSAAEPLTPYARLFNALEGWPPYADALIASLCAEWDFRRDYEPLARHFAHAYCDLEGNVYPNITIYDALASQEGLDMPDLDVIPYARQILKDDSYRSPLPADARRERLYRRIKDEFLPYFQHRTFIQTAALLYVHPDAEFRSQHEGLRQNLLYVFAVTDGDPRKIGRILERSEDRGGFMDESLKLVRKDQGWQSKIAAFRKQRIDTRWAMHEIARAVLRKHGFLRDH